MGSNRRRRGDRRHKQHAQERLGDLVFVELPVVGKSFEKGAPAAVVESVKAAFEVYAPIGGEVVEANPAIVANPSLVNSDPMGAAGLQIGARRSFGGRRASWMRRPTKRCWIERCRARSLLQNMRVRS